MATAQELKQERKQRLDNAVQFRTSDRLPVLIMGCIPVARIIDPEIVPADAMERPEYLADTGMAAVEKLKDVDALHGFTSIMSRTKGLSFMSNTKLPGLELARTEMIQIDERPMMDIADYDRIIEHGWKPYKDWYISEKLGLKPEDFLFSRRVRGYAGPLLEEHGYWEWNTVGNEPVFDYLSAMRGITAFFRDLRKIPEKVHEVQEIIYNETLEDITNGIKRSKAYAVMIQPAVRANCDFVSRKTFEQFAWPYIKRYTDNALALGGIPFFHYDARWDDFLDFFTDFPARRCIFDTDGLTDMDLIIKTLGDRMCITANTTPAMLTLAEPEEVYDFVSRQADQVGRDHFIVTSACGLPVNAKPENIEAMVAAARS